MVLGHSQLRHSHRADLLLRELYRLWIRRGNLLGYLRALLQFPPLPGLITFPIVVARLSDKTNLGKEGLILIFYLRVQSTVAEGVWWEEQEAGSQYTTARKQKKKI